jgi:hypothetical protein
MALKLSPEHLVARYLRSATNGKVLSVRKNRILTLLIFPIWIIAIIIGGVATKDAIDAVPNYKAIQEFKRGPYNHDNDDKNPYGGHNHHDWYGDGESIHQCNFDKGFWLNLGLKNPDHFDSVIGLADIAENYQESDLYNFFTLPLFFGLLVVLPWTILRIIFWIKDADKIKGSTVPRDITA